MLKGAGIKVVGGILLSVMVAMVVIAAVTVGGLADALQEGSESITNSTGGNNIEITDEPTSAKKTFSDAALFAFHRATKQACKEEGGTVKEYNDNHGGYEGLEGTSLTRYPKCIGASASAGRNINYEAGNDMEGLFSRVSFTIKDEFMIDTSNGEVGLEETGYVRDLFNVLPFADNDGFAIRSVREGSYKELTEDGDMTNGFYIAYLDIEGAEHRTNGFLKQVDGWNSEKGTYTNDIYTPREKFDILYPNGLKLQLCEGDEGYFQTNKWTANSDGEAPDNIAGPDKLYPHIVITDKGENCGRLGGVNKGNNAAGNIFYVSMDAGKTYPAWHRDYHPGYPIDLFDSGSSLNVGSDLSTLSYKIDPPSDDKCRIGVVDVDTGLSDTDENGFVDFSLGTTLEKSGKWPSGTSSQHESKSHPTEGDKTSQDVWKDLTANYGWNGDEISTHASAPKFSPYIVGPKGVKNKMELHGDMICAKPDSFSYAKWMICDYNLDSSLREGIEVVSSTYNCNPRTGEWSEE